MAGWIVIPGWDRFQHYKDRNPNWIKIYVELLHDPDYLNLSAHARGVLVGLWMMYAVSHRQIPDDTAIISRQLGCRVTRTTLDQLNHAGFIEYSASKPLAPRYQDASATLALTRSREEEKEEKRQELSKESSVSSHEQAKKNNTGKDGLLQEARTLALAWNGGSSDEFDNKLDTLEAVYQTKLGYLERDKLWDIAFTKTVQDDELF